MTSFMEFISDKKSIKSINLDDYSIDDLEVYINELKEEMSRVKEEIKKKELSKQEAQKFFK